jgi:hypothetical protein
MRDYGKLQAIKEEITAAITEMKDIDYEGSGTEEENNRSIQLGQKADELAQQFVTLYNTEQDGKVARYHDGRIILP